MYTRRIRIYILKAMHTLYQDILMDHYRFPRCKGRLAQHDNFSHAENPSCGDSIHIWIMVKEGILVAAGFEGAGCVISQAAASLLLEKALNKQTQDIRSYDASTMFDLIGMQLGPVRSRCALLALEAIHMALSQNSSKKEECAK